MRTATTLGLAVLLVIATTPNANAAFTSDQACNPDIIFCVTGSIHIYAATSDQPCIDAGDAKDPGEVCKAFVYAGSVSTVIPGVIVRLDGSGGHGEPVDCDGSNGLTSSVCSASHTAYYFADNSHCTSLNLDGYGVVGGQQAHRVELDINHAC